MRRSLPALLLALLGLAHVPAGAAAGGSSVRVDEGLVYGRASVGAPQAGRVKLRLDLYRPAKASSRPRPVVVLIHGGGFRGGARTSPDMVRLARRFARRGVAAASISYRLQPQEPVLSDRVAPLAEATPDAPLFDAMIAAVDDTLSAVAWLRKHEGRLGLDMDRLGLAGSSAGAITADHVAYVVDDFDIEGPEVAFVGNLWGGIFLPVTPSLEAAARQLERGEAPLFSVHGTADRTVPVDFSDRLDARARAVGVPREYIRAEGAGHGPAATGFSTRDLGGGETAEDRLLRFALPRLR